MSSPRTPSNTRKSGETTAEKRSNVATPQRAKPALANTPLSTTRKQTKISDWLSPSTLPPAAPPDNLGAQQEADNEMATPKARAELKKNAKAMGDLSSHLKRAAIKAELAETLRRRNATTADPTTSSTTSQQDPGNVSGSAMPPQMMMREAPKPPPQPLPPTRQYQAATVVQPILPRAPGKWWPPIPTDANFDPFSPVVSLTRRAGVSMNEEPEFRTSAAEHTETNPHNPFAWESPDTRPAWMITEEESRRLERDVANLTRQPLDIDLYPSWPPTEPGEPMMRIPTPFFPAPTPNDMDTRRQSATPAPGLNDSSRESTVEPRRGRPSKSQQKRKATSAIDTNKSNKKQKSPIKNGFANTIGSEVDDNDTFPAEIFVFDEDNYEARNGAAFMYQDTLLIPATKLPAPQDVIDTVIEHLGSMKSVNDTIAEPDFASSVCVHGSFSLAGPKSANNVAGNTKKADWFVASVGILKQFQTKRNESGLGPGYGATKAYADVKVLLWTKDQGPKARASRKERVPQKEDRLAAGMKGIGQSDIEMAH